MAYIVVKVLHIVCVVMLSATCCRKPNSHKMAAQARMKNGFLMVPVLVVLGES